MSAQDNRPQIVIQKKPYALQRYMKLMNKMIVRPETLQDSRLRYGVTSNVILKKTEEASGKHSKHVQQENSSNVWALG